MSGEGARVFHISDARSAGSGTQRLRCAATTADGRRCRNYSGPSGWCRIHQESAAAPGTPSGEPDESAAATPGPLRGLAGVLSALVDAVGDAARPEAELDGAGAGGAEAGGGAGAAQVDEAVAAALAFLRRRLTGDYDVDLYGFDRDLTEQVIVPLARPLYRRWWRVTTLGIENVPATGGALIVANHAGTLPFDAVMTKVALLDEHPASRHLRELAADLALRVPVVGPLARKSGSTLAHTDDALRLLSDGELVGVWPEGFKGIGKLYRDRYKLQRFGRGGFVEVALRARVPIVPVAIVGSEEIYPMIANARLLARLLGVPYFPITWQFPALGPLGAVPLPSKWTIEFGEPIDTAGYGPEAADDSMAVFELMDRVRDTIQQMLYRNLVGRRSIFF